MTYLGRVGEGQFSYKNGKPQHAYVIKRSGDLEAYSEEKVIHSMERVGVPDALKPEVLAHVREQFKNGFLTTDQLFSYVYKYLDKSDKKASLRLNLRKAIFELGPTGFPFEKYLARIFQSQGYKTMVGAKIMGECVMHEIDLVLEKDGKREIAEAKFHNDSGIRTDVQVALYTYARYLDVKQKNDFSRAWLITNTKLTLDAITYAQCKGISVLAWNYPNGGNLQKFVEDPQMYPVTILPEFTKEEKQFLIEDNIILCSDLIKLTDAEVMNFPMIKQTHLRKAIMSARSLLESHLPTNKSAIDIPAL